MAQEVVIIDYGSGNLRSMHNALERVAPEGHAVRVSHDPRAILDAERVVLPGVGAFGACWNKLQEAGLLSPLRDVVGSGRPMLGVCVGMQVLADKGEEFGDHEGLGWIPGVTRKIPVPPNMKLPHIGWAALSERRHILFDGIRAEAHFYFVHSYFLDAADASDVAARVDVGGPVTAAVARRNLFGSQFHPEKSDRAGLQLLANFCRWNP